MSGITGNDEFSFVDAFQWLETNIALESDTDEVLPDTDGSPGSTEETKKRKRKPKRRKRALTGVSRQRRAANARERRRIQGVNMAFIELRKILPVLSRDEVSKIEILRLATKWIAYLTTVLIEDEENKYSVQSPKSTAVNLMNKHANTLPAELQEKLDVVKTIKEKEDNFEICFMNDHSNTPQSQDWQMTFNSYEINTQYSVNNNICETNNAVNNNSKLTNMAPVLQHHEENMKACLLPGNSYFGVNGYTAAPMASYGNC
ncbi:uncharacterized protein LOC144433955 [Glandiceps talaboti]